MNKNYLILIVWLFGLCMYAQESFSEVEVLSAFEDYAELEREIVYLHLNKSTYIKGESIGLSAYILEKYSNTLAKETTNLYCTITDAKDKVIKQKLLLVGNGIAISDFEIDSLFTSGEYTIKAYTHWMKNFEEQNYYTQKIRIIDPNVEIEAKPLLSTSEFDAQFLPEGGHLVSELNNTIGVTIKDGLGFGIPNLECEVLNSKGEPITSFTLNSLGIGRFNLNPQLNESYYVVTNLDNKDYEFKIGQPDRNGLALVLTDLKTKIALTIKTNTSTLSTIKDQRYTLAIHNGNDIKLSYFKFEDSLEIVKTIPKINLFSGINIVTIFDRDNTPILERQYFNYVGLNFAVSKEVIAERKGDSLLVSVPYHTMDTNIFNCFSISVLPEHTRAYNHHHNLASSVLLQPYVKGYVENARYYFTEITDKKAYDLDNLLLTQGWSSYDWNEIFNQPPDYDYDYDNGISYLANFTNDKNTQLVLYPTLNTPFEMIELGDDDTAFEKQGLFPINDEAISIGAFDKKGKGKMPNIHLTFSPSKIPEFNFNPYTHILSTREPRTSNIISSSEFNTLGWKTIEKLDEVLLKAKKEYTRVEKIKNATIGKVEFFDDKKKLKYQTLGRYLSTRGFIIDENKSGGSGFQIFRKYTASLKGAFASDNIPVVYIDDVILHSDLGILRDLTLNDIEYIEINFSGIGGGMRGGGGIIKIKTNPFSSLKSTKRKTIHKSFEIPLKFDVAKRFYIPKYISYDSDFFSEYGVVDWFSNVSTNPNGILNLKVLDNKATDIKLCIEGFSNDGTFISEIKTLKIN